jgi:hypothetical protein
LTTTGPAPTTVAAQTGDLKGHAAEDSSIRAFDTQPGVPNAAGTIPSNSTLTFTLWMRKTAAYGTVFPRAQEITA